MAYSSILGADQAPTQASGRDSQALGPSDNSDSGSDAIGTSESHGDSDASGTGEGGALPGSEAEEGRDIMPDHVVRLGLNAGTPDEDEADTDTLTNLDSDTDADNLDAGADER